jgi:hypothetical protein
MPETSTAPSLDDARAYLYRELHAPFFLQKLASDYGIVPQNEAEINALLAMGNQLHQLDRQAAAEKQAAVNPLIAAAYYSLGGVPDQITPSGGDNDQALKQAAAAVLGDDNIRQATAALVAHLTQP